MSLGALIRRTRRIGRAWWPLGAGPLLAVVLAGSSPSGPAVASRPGSGAGTALVASRQAPSTPGPAAAASPEGWTPAPLVPAVTTIPAAARPAAAVPAVSHGRAGSGATVVTGAPQGVPTTAAPVIARPETNRSAPVPPRVPVPTQGAVWPGDFPDPSVLKVGTFYYAYSTEVGLQAVPTIRSVDLEHWSFVGNALAALPPWSDGNDVWAPAVVADGLDYVLFYTTRDARTGDQCISRAQSTSPTGPFLDASVDPFLCQLDQGGDIDPDPVVAADGSEWLVFKSQGTVEGRPPRIWAQRLAPGWSALQGSPVAILGLSQRWEGSVVEAPAMLREGSEYLLFYSGNDWATDRYAIGYAVCRSVTGPCTKPQDGPLLSTHGDEAGPGSPGLFTDGLGRIRIAYHAWSPGHVGYPGGARSLRIGTVTIAGGRASISG